MTQRKTNQPARQLRRRGSKLHVELAQEIGEGILNGTYAPGTLLPNEATWGAMFGASRTAVREAIKTLNGKGLLVSRPKVGSRVEPRSRWNLLDRDVLAWHCAAMDRKTLLISIQEVRRILEPGAAELAARKRSPQQITRLEAALGGMRAARTAEAMVAPDVDFHVALLEAANNELLIPFGIIIEQALRQMFEFTSRHNPRPMGVIPLHEAVFVAVREADPAAARAAVIALLADTDEIIVRRASPGRRVRGG
ncbi:MAG: FadR family transcriptional regulator [Alphaproteobacteria bacterium]|nr:FadR family transcriptional regulator [Alphaproteobacteria bacterium]